jgi:hypothetical protein
MQHKMHVFILFTFLSEIFLVLGKIKRDMIKDVYWFSYKLLIILVRFYLIKLTFFFYFFEKYSNINFHENSFSWSRVVPKRTDKTKLIVAFISLAIAPNK